MVNEDGILWLEKQRGFSSVRILRTISTPLNLYSFRPRTGGRVGGFI